MTYEIERSNKMGITGVKAGDRARQKDFDSAIYGVTPNVFEAMATEFVMLGSGNKTTALSLGEQLYTARGS